MSTGRPNLLIFMPDQLRADSVGCFGNAVVKTPNIDALAARGTRFSNAFANHPVCGPSRVNLMTGWYPHTRGHRTLTHLVKPWEPNLLRYLKDAGYHVAWAGARGDTFAPGVTEESTDFCGWIRPPKSLFSKPRFPEGHKYFNAFYDGVREPVFDFDEATTDTAETWLANAPREPWVLFVPLIFPHLPFAVEEPWYSAHSPDQMPARIRVEDCRGPRPGFHAAIREKYGLERLDEADWAEIRRTYYGMISRVDAQLGRTVAAVDRSGATDRTAVFFFTDHGEYAGDYGLIEKWPAGLEDCLVHNPLIVHVPGAPEGQVAEGFVEMVDILPTLLELGDTKAAHTHFGRSFVPAIHDPSAVTRDAAFSEGGFSRADAELFEDVIPGRYAGKNQLQRDRPELVGKCIAVRTHDYTFVYRLYEPSELYDRRKDPSETHNLIEEPALAATVDALRERVLQWLLETSDVIPWDKDPRFPKIPSGYRA